MNAGRLPTGSPLPPAVSAASTRPPATDLSPTARQIWARLRGLLFAAAVLAVAGVAIAAVRSEGRHGTLDPRSTDRNGTHALSVLLHERGVRTTVVTTVAGATAAAEQDTTLLVASPDTLTERQRRLLRPALRRAGRSVLVAPGPASVDSLVPGVHAAAPAESEPTPPDCDFPGARRAGDADLGGLRYTDAVGHADACYLHQGLPSLLRLPPVAGDGGTVAGGGDTVLLGSPEPLYNARLAEHGNASLTLQLLGAHPHLLWYLPSSGDASAARGGERGFLDLLPDGWAWATAQLGVAALLAAAWRARRLGPLVQERLPVAVPASETTEGRARLYHRADARGHAADALRSATRTRLAPLVGVAAAQAHEADVLVPAVTAHTSRLASGASGSSGGLSSPPSSVHDVLFGPAPAHDSELVRLADALDAWERHVTAALPASSPPPTDKDSRP